MRGRPTRAARLGIAAAGLAVALAAPRANAQAVIKVNDDVNFKFGFLLQPQADWSENAANGSTSQNLFVRRVRVLVGGQLAKNVTFFFETDSPNYGKVVGGVKTGSGMLVQDAFVSWKLAAQLKLALCTDALVMPKSCVRADAGLGRTPLAGVPPTASIEALA